MKMKNFVYVAALAVALIASGCASQADTTNQDPHAGHEAQQPNQSMEPVKLNDKQVQLPNGDIQEPTASIDLLPTFLTKAKPETREAYKIAAQNNDILQFIPCYCGCGKSAGHTNNAHCFIKEVKADNTVVWDDHGTRCATCMNIAITSARLKESGKSLKEIRNIIDNQYKTGYAAPTPTPMPN